MILSVTLLEHNTAICLLNKAIELPVAKYIYLGVRLHQSYVSLPGRLKLQITHLKNLKYTIMPCDQGR